jgi:SPP1 family predicted phage head-tail adaptor
MKAGDFQHRVSIEERVQKRDEYGAPVESWETVATVWAAIEPISGREQLQGKQLNADVTTRIRMRYRTGISAVMRVTWGAHVYNILNVIHYRTSSRELILECREVDGSS